ncbi:hypothetical protein AUEXF2481DRAFT_28275 [Aureobasidium subglaciale EXF-2481]|uniref:Isochorismatase-like domain-containing protein n=1 Tax=Aureobasidium subglaciale (strain EXF-2481) TaxID=1043005 RepID=A0A074YQF0_AURSE|nr:uncharacterized protein AUEXF2481DRAFT_28275 [Aureobasidium subglaciale EXF-2481]KEQ96312.1 hypothetical protein AUEXF2481DRAFT_28275 [Aureobasidium subglaciale EXF-2481]
MFSEEALVVVDVQDGIANLVDGVPDAEQINNAIGSVLHRARQHNDQADQTGLAKPIKILFIQHDDKDPSDPLWRGKTTWELVFPPRKGITTEMLVSKNVGECLYCYSSLCVLTTCAGNMFTSNPDLTHSLLAEGITSLVFVGLQTDFCVRASILGAIASGFQAQNITLLQGAHSTYDQESTGKSYMQVKDDIEGQLAALGVCLRGWQEFGK